jgi:hypothetical protein
MCASLLMTLALKEPGPGAERFVFLEEATSFKDLTGYALQTSACLIKAIQQI